MSLTYDYVWPSMTQYVYIFLRMFKFLSMEPEDIA